MTENNNDLICPCCKQHWFTEKNAYEICPVCGWEDDKVQRVCPDYAGGANKMSLREAIIKWNEREEESIW